MTKTQCIAGAALAALLISPAFADPPARPQPLTSDQFSALRQIEREPQHLAVNDVHATYQSEVEQRREITRTADDVTSAATFLGYIGAIVTILCIAAPL